MESPTLADGIATPDRDDQSGCAARDRRAARSRTTTGFRDEAKLAVTSGPTCRDAEDGPFLQGASTLAR
jgi:hypothetical protein